MREIQIMYLEKNVDVEKVIIQIERNIIYYELRYDWIFLSKVFDDLMNFWGFIRLFLPIIFIHSHILLQLLNPPPQVT